MAFFRIDKVVHELDVHEPSSESYGAVAQYVALQFEVVAVFDC